ncbi:hypothetical protein Q3G72_010103 [Acer saccharum]|nr:hypothetical protein Q3G72_010103 [Acer saccharum]
MKSVPLNVATIFTVLATLRSMSEPMRWISEAIFMLIEMKISTDNLNTFLLDDELITCKWNNYIYFSSTLDTSGTIHDNIFFGKQLETTKYEMVTKACALDKDIYNFSHGDLTETCKPDHASLGKAWHDTTQHNHMGFVDGEMSFQEFVHCSAHLLL